jgi:hypothetical protein
LPMAHGQDVLTDCNKPGRDNIIICLEIAGWNLR